MKNLILSSVLFFSFATSFAGELPFQCIAEKMQAINSDLYFDITKSEIAKFLVDKTSYGHLDAQQSLFLCLNEAKRELILSCVSSKLEATNSDIWSNLTNEEVEKMLKDPSAVGHEYASEFERSCAFEIKM